MSHVSKAPKNQFSDRIIDFTENGSNATMITHILAKKCMLFANPMDRMIEVVGRKQEHHSTKLYKLKLTDYFGETHCIQLIGIDKIYTNPGPCNHDAA